MLKVVMDRMGPAASFKSKRLKKEKEKTDQGAIGDCGRCISKE